MLSREPSVNGSIMMDVFGSRDGKKWSRYGLGR